MAARLGHAVTGNHVEAQTIGQRITQLSRLSASRAVERPYHAAPTINAKHMNALMPSVSHSVRRCRAEQGLNALSSWQQLPMAACLPHRQAKVIVRVSPL